MFSPLSLKFWNIYLYIYLYLCEHIDIDFPRRSSVIESRLLYLRLDVKIKWEVFPYLNFLIWIYLLLSSVCSMHLFFPHLCLCLFLPPPHPGRLGSTQNKYARRVYMQKMLILPARVSEKDFLFLIQIQMTVASECGYRLSHNMCTVEIFPFLL